MGRFFHRVGKYMIDILPDSHLIYLACKRYINRYSGENNDDMMTNGEYLFLKEVLPRCQTVFDVGANLGRWTTLALSINPSLQIHCFEPSRGTFERLQENHFPPNVRCNHSGLGAVPGEGHLFVFEGASGLNSLYRRDGLQHLNLPAQDNTEVVWLDTVDHYCSWNNIPTVDFIKLDVEGHELEVLKGMEESLKKASIKMIQFEYGGCNIDARILLKDIWDYLKSFPYSFHKIYQQGIRNVEAYS